MVVHKTNDPRRLNSLRCELDSIRLLNIMVLRRMSDFESRSIGFGQHQIDPNSKAASCRCHAGRGSFLQPLDTTCAERVPQALPIDNVRLPIAGSNPVNQQSAIDNRQCINYDLTALAPTPSPRRTYGHQGSIPGGTESV